MRIVEARVGVVWIVMAVRGGPCIQVLSCVQVVFGVEAAALELRWCGCFVAWGVAEFIAWLAGCLNSLTCNQSSFTH